MKTNYYAILLKKNKSFLKKVLPDAAGRARFRNVVRIVFKELIAGFGVWAMPML
jgi:hypothetical protein